MTTLFKLPIPFSILIISISILVLAVPSHQQRTPQRKSSFPTVARAVSKIVGAANNIVKTPPASNMRNRRQFNGRSMARDFLLAHNVERIKVGEPPLTWNKTLVRVARRWLNKRINDCKLLHSDGEYGENLFWGGRDHWTPTEVVQSWASEADSYTVETNECKKGEMCGHYTQIVWRDTLQVGCARIKCNNGGGVLIMCCYDPLGNYLDESPFDSHNLTPEPSPSSPSSPSPTTATPVTPPSQATPPTPTTVTPVTPPSHATPPTPTAATTGTRPSRATPSPTTPAQK